MSDERNGSFLDAAGCCKLCDGELPHGHMEECDLWKVEARAMELDRLLDEALEWVPKRGIGGEFRDKVRKARASSNEEEQRNGP